MDPTGKEFRCWYHFEAPGVDPRRRFSAGVDGFQAIQLALVIIAEHLKIIEKEWGSRLRWHDRDPGFPLTY